MDVIILSKLEGVPMIRSASRIHGWGVLRKAFAVSSLHVYTCVYM